MMGFTCTILATWEAQLMWVSSFLYGNDVEAADHLFSVFTYGLTKYVLSLIDHFKISNHCSYTLVVEAPLA